MYIPLKCSCVVICDSTLLVRLELIKEEKKLSLSKWLMDILKYTILSTNITKGLLQSVWSQVSHQHLLANASCSLNGRRCPTIMYCQRSLYSLYGLGCPTVMYYQRPLTVYGLRCLRIYYQMPLTVCMVSGVPPACIVIVCGLWS